MNVLQEFQDTEYQKDFGDMWFPWGGFSYGRGDWLTNMFSYFLFGYGYSGQTHTQKTELKPVSEYVYGNSLISRGDYTQSYSRYGYVSGYVTGNREYYGQDILGSTMIVTNGAAGVVQKYAYDAYGNNYEGSFAGSNNIGYNGKRYDSGTGWYDYGFRDYDSRTGRFTTVDPIRNGMNWYAYCGGDPINCIDLWGLSQESDKNLLKVSVDDAYGFQNATTRYLLGGKEGVAGQTPIDGIALTNADGQVIHTFTNDKAIKQYANYLDNEKGNISGVEGVVDNLGTITTLANTANIPHMSKVSSVLSAISTLFDVKKTFENPTANNITDLGLDVVGLFGGTPGALISIYGSATKVEVEWWVQTMAEGTVEFNNRAKEYMDEQIMEEMERYEQ